MADSNYLDRAPESDEVSPYDERNLVTYLRLLDADAENADWKEAVRLIFNIDPDVCPERAKDMHASHLERARWMSRVGYRQLAARGSEKPPISSK